MSHEMANCEPWQAAMEALILVATLRRTDYDGARRHHASV
jgi:hypothetical protein